MVSGLRPIALLTLLSLFLLAGTSNLCLFERLVVAVAGPVLGLEEPHHLQHCSGAATGHAEPDSPGTDEHCNSDPFVISSAAAGLVSSAGFGPALLCAFFISILFVRTDYFSVHIPSRRGFGLTGPPFTTRQLTAPLLLAPQAPPGPR